MIDLQSIWNNQPDQKMWDRLFLGLQNPPMNTIVSLGDIAFIGEASDAWWCVRGINWYDMNLRKKVINILLNGVKRAALETSDHRVVTSIESLDKWIVGGLVNLLQSDRMLEKISKTSFLAESLKSTVMSATGAPEMVYAAAKAVENAIAEQHENWLSALRAEKKKQKIDIISAFPPIIFKINVDASFKI